MDQEPANAPATGILKVEMPFGRDNRANFEFFGDSEFLISALFGVRQATRSIDLTDWASDQSTTRAEYQDELKRATMAIRSDESFKGKLVTYFPPVTERSR